MKRRGLTALALAIALSLGASSASAASITWEFHGVIRRADVYPRYTGADTSEMTAALSSLGATVGSPVSGIVRFDPTIADSRPEPESSAFNDAVLEFSLSFSGGTTGLPPDLDPNPLNPLHYIVVSSYTTTEPAFSLEFIDADLLDPIGILSFFPFVAFELSSHDPATFDPSSIPLNPPPLSLLDPYGMVDSATGMGSHLLFFGLNDDAGFEIDAEFTSLVRVAEPGAAWLALTGLALLSGSLRRSSPRW